MFVHGDYFHVVNRVRGMGAAAFRVDHLLAIAVVGEDEERAALGECGIDDFADAFVGHLTGLARRGKHPGVAGHVAIGEIDDDQIVLAGLDSLHRLIADAVGAHFGGLVVGGDLFIGRDDLAVFAGEVIVAVVVKEEGDVRIFLGLGTAELLEAEVGDVFAEDVFLLRGLGIGDVHG